MHHFEHMHKGALALITVWILLFVGCAQGELEAPGADAGQTMSGCEVDTDCPDGQRCNVLSDACVVLAQDMPEDTGPSPQEDMPVDLSADADDGGEPVDMPVDLGVDDGGPMGCEPACGQDEVCEEGICVPDEPVCEPACASNLVCVDGSCELPPEKECDPACAPNQRCEDGVCVTPMCNPACEAPGMCVNGACEFPTCQNEGDPCDSVALEQGDFYCLVEAASMRARCYKKCPQNESPRGCSVGQRCLAAVESSPNLTFCLDSICATNGDCTDGADRGTCVQLENDFGYCQTAGAVGVGGACNLESGPHCSQGLLCESTSGGPQGLCRQSCRPWSSPTGCPGGQVCRLFSNRTGTCTASTDTTGQRAFETCTTPDNWCADATRCVQGNPNNICYRYCRPGQGDCVGFGSVACDNYIFPGDRSLGICNADCTQFPNFCGTNEDCMPDGVCKRRCTQNNVVRDCCNGATPCAWECRAGYCE